MNQRIVIANIDQFSVIVSKVPTILNLNAFKVMKDIFNSKPAGGCTKCNSKARQLGVYRPQFEACFALLGEDEKNRLKKLLDTEQLCYFRRDEQGQINQTCF